MSRTRALLLVIFGRSKYPFWRSAGLILGYTGLRPLIVHRDSVGILVAVLFLAPGATAFIASAKPPVSSVCELARYLLLTFFFTALISGAYTLLPRIAGV